MRTSTPIASRGSGTIEMTWPEMSLQAAHALMTAPGTAFEMEERVLHGVRQRVWKNGPQTLRDVFLAGRVHGAKTFLVYEDERATFEAFARATLAPIFYHIRWR